MTRQTLVPLLALVLLPLSADAEKLPVKVEPAKAGLDATKLTALRPRLQEYVDKHQMAGAVTIVGGHGHIGSLEMVGFADLEKKTPMRADTIFRIASETKIATTTAVMMLVDDGKLVVEDPVEKYLPEFRGQQLIQKREGNTLTLVAPARPITLKDLLTHTSGFRCDLPPGFSDLHRKKNRTLQEAVIAFSQQPLVTPPGTVWKYCGPSIDTLGRLVEVASGKTFEAFLSERIFKPLGMKDTTFWPTPAQRARMAVLYKKDGEGLARGDRQDTPVGADQTPQQKYPTPSGGLYSTALDLAKLFQMLVDRGMYNGKRYVTAATVEKFTSVHFSAPPDVKVGFTPGLGMGLGMQVVMKPTGVTEMLSPGTFGHGGAFGTQGWMDPTKGVYYLLMIQRQGFGDGDALVMRKTLQEVGAAALVPSTAAR
jgi:CubicO group peptidase (beta-lactamase class C family)